MAVSQELIDFVKEGLQRTIPREQLEKALLAAGWTGEQVKGAIASFAATDFPIPVPRPRPYLSARDAFMYVVLFSTLYLSAYNFGSLIFEFIDVAFPDPAAQGRDVSLLSIRWSVSSLIVAFPVFVYVAWLVARGVRLDPTKRASKVRRQLTYLTLFIASCVLIGDVTALVYNFLGGDLTTRFVLKILTVGAIAGAGFGYYLRELRADESVL